MPINRCLCERTNLPKDALATATPETAWNVIQEITALDHSDRILANVGAGPFERTRLLMTCEIELRPLHRHLGSMKADVAHGP
jgi:hypothetical protein